MTTLAAALVALRPGAQWTATGNDLSSLVWLDTVQSRPTDAAISAAMAAPLPSDVDLERDRRISMGVTVTLSTGKTIPVQTRDETDARNLLTLKVVALDALRTGSTTAITFRDTANVNWSLTPAELDEMTSLVAANGQSIYAKSWALKAMSPIPSDYAADSHWT